MHSAAHLIAETSRFLWIAYAALGVVIFCLSWVDNRRLANRLLLFELALALVLGTAFMWLPWDSHDNTYDLFGAFLWSAFAIGIVAATAILVLVSRALRVLIGDGTDEA